MMVALVVVQATHSHSALRTPAADSELEPIGFKLHAVIDAAAVLPDRRLLQVDTTLSQFDPLRLFLCLAHIFLAFVVGNTSPMNS